MISNAFFLLTLYICVSQAHEWSFESECLKVTPLNGLSIDKFLGSWYVIQQTDTDNSKCLTLNYTRFSETSLRVTKMRQFTLFDRFGVNHTSSYTGSLDIPFEDKPGFMRVKWPGNLIGKGDYIVFDTDYENYAAIFDCQEVLGYFKRENVAILSRTPDLSDLFLDRVKRRMESFGLEPNSLDILDHSGCTSPEESQYKIAIDGETVKSVITQTVDGIKDAAQAVSTGVEDAATYLSDGVLRAWNGVTRSGNLEAKKVEAEDTIRK